MRELIACGAARRAIVRRSADAIEQQRGRAGQHAARSSRARSMATRRAAPARTRDRRTATARAPARPRAPTAPAPRQRRQRACTRGAAPFEQHEAEQHRAGPLPAGRAQQLAHRLVLARVQERLARTSHQRGGGAQCSRQRRARRMRPAVARSPPAAAPCERAPRSHHGRRRPQPAAARRSPAPSLRRHRRRPTARPARTRRGGRRTLTGAGPASSPCAS